MPSVEGVRISELPQATTVDESDVLAGVQYGTTKRFSMSRILEWIKEHIGLTAGEVGAVDANDVGVPGGVAALDSNGKVPASELDLSSKQNTITSAGILKGDGAGGVSAAVAGTDYATPTQLDAKANQAQLATVESGSTASRNYAVGEYFCLNDLLYRVTSAISSGQPFNQGANCEQVTEGGLNSFHCLSGDLSTDITGVYMRFGSLVTVYLGTCLVAINGSSYTNMGNLPFACYQGINTNVYGNDREYAVDIAANSRVLRIKWIGGAALPSSGKPSIRGIVQYITTE